MVEMVEEKRKGKKKRRNAKGIHTNERNFWGKLTAVRERRVQGKRLSLEANSTAMKGVCLGLIRGKDGIERRMKDGCKCLIDRTNVHVKHLLAGATASVVARTILAPLERVKVELQLNQQPGGPLSTCAKIVREEGMRGLWKGNALNLLRTAPYRSINYYTYDNTKAAICHITGKRELNNVQRLFAGATAGAAAILCCFPLDVLRTRMLSKGGEDFYRRGVLATVAHVLKKEKFAAFYVGVIPALISVIPSNAVFYTVYDSLKANHLRHFAGKKKKNRVIAEGENGSSYNSSYNSRDKDHRSVGAATLEEKEKEEEMDPRFNLLYGGLAGIAAETSVYPLEVIRRRLQIIALAARNKGLLDGIYLKDMLAAMSMQSQSAGKGIVAGGELRSIGSLKSMTTLLRCIINREGVKGFYWGILPTACQVLPSAAISYYIFEECKKRLKVDK